MTLLIPNPVQEESTVDATDLTTALTLVNSLKKKVNELTRQLNLLFDSLESMNDY